MVLRIKLAVFRTADLALCLVLTGRFPADVVGQLLAAIITLVVLVCIDAILRLRACRASVNRHLYGKGGLLQVLHPLRPELRGHGG